MVFAAAAAVAFKCTILIWFIYLKSYLYLYWSSSLSFSVFRYVRICLELTYVYLLSPLSSYYVVYAVQIERHHVHDWNKSGLSKNLNTPNSIFWPHRVYFETFQVNSGTRRHYVAISFQWLDNISWKIQFSSARNFYFYFICYSICRCTLVGDRLKNFILRQRMDIVTKPFTEFENEKNILSFF